MLHALKQDNFISQLLQGLMIIGLKFHLKEYNECWGYRFRVGWWVLLQAITENMNAFNWSYITWKFVNCLYSQVLEDSFVAHFNNYLSGVSLVFSDKASGRMALNITSFMAINSPLSMLTAEYTLPYWPSPAFTKQNNQIYQVSLGTGKYCIGMDQFCIKISILPQSHVIEKYFILLYAIAWSRFLLITHTHGW